MGRKMEIGPSGCQCSHGPADLVFSRGISFFPCIHRHSFSGMGFLPVCREEFCRNPVYKKLLPHPRLSAQQRQSISVSDTIQPVCPVYGHTGCMVSTKKTAFPGCEAANASKASVSEANAITQLWAWVPRTGISKIFPAKTLEVATQPPT